MSLICKMQTLRDSSDSELSEEDNSIFHDAESANQVSTPNADVPVNTLDMPNNDLDMPNDVSDIDAFPDSINDVSNDLHFYYY